MILAAVTLAAAVPGLANNAELTRSVVACGVDPNQVVAGWDPKLKSNLVIFRQASLSERAMTCLTKVSVKYQANFALMDPHFRIEPAAKR